MRAGSLRKQVVLQKRVTGSPQSTSTGAANTSWVTQATVYGSLRPLGGRELFLAQQVESKVECEIEIRYRADVPVAASWRAVVDGVNYNIEAVIEPESRKIRRILRCSKGLKDG